MSSLNFIGGEKGGVGKSVTARALAQYFIDRGHAFTGFDTDRSHNSFTRFYENYACPVVVDSYQGLDMIVDAFEDDLAQSVVVDLAAQTIAPVARWMNESQLLEVMAELGIAVNVWHVLDDGRDSVMLLERLLDQLGTPAAGRPAPHYVLVRNLGRGTDFSLLESSQAFARAQAAGASVIDLPALQEASMRKIDHHSASFWSAVNNREGEHTLGLLERQRVKMWLNRVYAEFDKLPLGVGAAPEPALERTAA